MLHLHLIPETPATGPVYGCAEIRLLRPWRHPWLAGKAKVTSGPRLPSGRLDAVITQRAGPVGASLADVQMLIAECRHRGIPRLHDLDDDLLSEHPSPPLEVWIDDGRPRLRALLRDADAVITSTPTLASRVMRLNTHVFTWANALDEALVRPGEPTPEGPVDLGYFGTLSHLEDLLSVVQPLGAALAQRVPRPKVAICGISEDARIASLFASQAEVSLLPVEGDYARFLRIGQERPAWRAGIAPLADSAFSRSKSDIKFLDYALCGIPGIYADVPVYAAVVDGETGLKAAPSEFGHALRRLLDDTALRERIRRNARDYLMTERLIGRRIGSLWDILQQVLDKGARKASAA
jgi:glycosyltransferase involved in cell wall biosynthesis